jgi:hypothetical protein
MPRLLLVCTLLSAFSLVATAHAQDTLRRVPLVFHVVQQAGKPVADAAFLAAQLEHANVIYRALGFTLVAVAQKKLSAAHARLVERSDRDALRASLTPGVINCFIVATLMDVDEPGRERRGVHWHVRKEPSKHFVIVSAISGPYVLAHELGHFLGNPEHSDTPGNLMSYQHTEEVPVLDEVQKQHVLRTLDMLFQTGELTPNAKR